MPPPTSSSTASEATDILNDSSASNISFTSNDMAKDVALTAVGSGGGSGHEASGEQLLIHEKISTVEEKTVKRVPRESREQLPGNIELVFEAGGPSRPKPVYTSYSSSLDKPQGIEFNSSEYVG